MRLTKRYVSDLDQSGEVVCCGSTFSGSRSTIAPMAQPSVLRHDPLTLAALGAAAYIVADVTHEAIGHGGMCLVSGGKITLLTSVFFRNEPASRVVAAAGPCANLIAGALFWMVCRMRRNLSPAAQLFVVLAMTFNFFWAAGYFIYSGVTDVGDWAIALGGPPLDLWWRVALIAVGVVAYAGLARPVARGFAGLTCADTWRLILIPYLGAGLAACVAAMFYWRDPAGAVVDAIRETLFANMVLLLISPRIARSAAAAAPAIVRRDRRWLFATGVLFVVFVLVLGRGLTPN